MDSFRFVQQSGVSPSYCHCPPYHDADLGKHFDRLTQRTSTASTASGSLATTHDYASEVSTASASQAPPPFRIAACLPFPRADSSSHHHHDGYPLPANRRKKRNRKKVFPFLLSWLRRRPTSPSQSHRPPHGLESAAESDADVSISPLADLHRMPSCTDDDMLLLSQDTVKSAPDHPLPSSDDTPLPSPPTSSAVLFERRSQRTYTVSGVDPTLELTAVCWREKRRQCASPVNEPPLIEPGQAGAVASQPSWDSRVGVQVSQALHKSLCKNLKVIGHYQRRYLEDKRAKLKAREELLRYHSHSPYFRLHQSQSQKEKDSSGSTRRSGDTTLRRLVSSGSTVESLSDMNMLGSSSSSNKKAALRSQRTAPNLASVSGGGEDTPHPLTHGTPPEQGVTTPVASLCPPSPSSVISISYCPSDEWSAGLISHSSSKDALLPPAPPSAESISMRRQVRQGITRSMRELVASWASEQGGKGEGAAAAGGGGTLPMLGDSDGGSRKKDGEGKGKKSKRSTPIDELLDRERRARDLQSSMQKARSIRLRLQEITREELQANATLSETSRLGFEGDRSTLHPTFVPPTHRVLPSPPGPPEPPTPPSLLQPPDSPSLRPRHTPQHSNRGGGGFSYMGLVHTHTHTHQKDTISSISISSGKGPQEDTKLLSDTSSTLSSSSVESGSGGLKNVTVGPTVDADVLTALEEQIRGCDALLYAARKGVEGWSDFLSAV